MIRVLVVDDVETVRHAVRLILSLEPDIAVVADAANGLAGLRLARELHPDVIVLDLHMPGMDGFAVMRELSTRLPETRVVVLSGDVGFRTTAFAFGASAFVPKGSAVAELPGAVHAAFAERHVPALPLLGAPQPHAI